MVGSNFAEIISNLVNMLEDVNSEITGRITELRSIYNHLVNYQESASDSIPTVPLQVNIIKGLYFVHLYSCLEYSVSALTQETLSIIESKNLTVNSFKPILLSVILDSKCNSLEAGNGKKQWERRKNLFHEIENDNVPAIDITVLPTGEGNLKYRQLKLIFDMLCMMDEPIPDQRLIGRLEELVDNRNKIAHGRESCQSVGSRYSISDIEIILSDIISICAHLVLVYEEYLDKEFYKKIIS